jgi:hypothetical protein
MNPFTSPRPAYKWCHVVCTIARQRELLKIPATARFCERSILSRRILSHSIVAAASLTPSQIRLLLRLPVRATRKEILRAVRRATAQVMRSAGVVGRWEPVLWGDAAWCFVLRSATAVAAVRRHMYARDATIGSPIPFPLASDSTVALSASISEECSSSSYDVFGLWQHEILKRGRVR